MGDKNCKQTNVPSVDNTTSTCTECGYSDFKCITSTIGYVYLGLAPGASAEDVVLKLVKKLVAQSKKIKDLQTDLTALTARVLDLETP